MGQKFIVFPCVFVAGSGEEISKVMLKGKLFRQIRFVFSPIEDKLCTGKRRRERNQSDESVFLFAGVSTRWGNLLFIFLLLAAFGWVAQVALPTDINQFIRFTRLWFIDRAAISRRQETPMRSGSARWSHSGSALAECRRRAATFVPLPACSCCCRWWKRHSAWKTSLACHWPTSMPSIIFHQDFLSIIAEPNANCTATADLMMSDDKVQSREKKNKPLKMRS